MARSNVEPSFRISAGAILTVISFPGYLKSLFFKAALKNNDFKYPGKEITVNMAPADIRKEGSTFDLAIAMGILAASDQMKLERLEEYILLGELSLDGGLQPIKGVLPIAMQAKQEGFKGIILPEANAEEAAIVEGIDVYGNRKYA